METHTGVKGDHYTSALEIHKVMIQWRTNSRENTNIGNHQCHDLRWTRTAQIAKVMGPKWGPPGSCRPQMGPMLAPWTLLSGCIYVVRNLLHPHKFTNQWWNSLEPSKCTTPQRILNMRTYHCPSVISVLCKSWSTKYNTWSSYEQNGWLCKYPK